MTRPAPDAPVETPWQGKYISVKTKGSWEYVSRPNGVRAAVILALDDAPDGQHVILVEQYRVPLGKACIELPAGLVGDVEVGEPAFLAAQRELEEETGFRAADWQDAGEYYSSPGMVSESFSLFVAKSLSKVGPGGGVNDEDITVHRVRLNNISQFLAQKRAEGAAVDVRILMLLGAKLIG
jgi:ADP-ribose pyrophosphatase